MYIGEDKKKVSKIVKNQMPYFHKMYEELIKSMPFLHWKQSEGIIEVIYFFVFILYHLNNRY